VGQVGARRGVAPPGGSPLADCLELGRPRCGDEPLKTACGWPTIDGAISASTDTPSKHRRSNRELARTTGLVVLAVVATLFAVLNLEKVEVHWLFFGKSQAPLIVVIVLSVLVGVVFTHFAERRFAKRR
jgi:uncharacterized integral membrane protein